MGPRLLVIGTSFVDIKGIPTGHFIPNGRNEGIMKCVHGGVGRNIAEDVANLGAKTTFVSIIDNNGMGDELVTHLEECGVDSSYIGRTSGGMGTWIAVFDPNGDVCANVSVRPDFSYVEHILEEKHETLFRDADGILIEFDADEPIIRKTIGYAKEYNKPVFGVISNMEIAKERKEYFKYLECFVCNRIEIGQLEGTDMLKFTPTEMLSYIKERISDIGFMNLIVTMDSDGAVFCSSNGKSGICSANNAKVVDTTGAGDAFFAAASFALAEGKGLEYACRYGNEIAAKVISSDNNVYSKNCYI